MRDSAEKLLGRFAPHVLFFFSRASTKLEALRVANPDHDTMGMLADAGGASV